MIPFRKFLEFNKEELHDYLESINFFVNFFNAASPLGKTQSEGTFIQSWWPGMPGEVNWKTGWWDERNIQVKIPTPTRYRKILKKGLSRVGEIYIPITCDAPRIELRADTEWGLISIGTIEFMMTPPYLILGIYDGCGPGRKQVDRAAEISTGIFEEVFGI